MPSRPDFFLVNPVARSFIITANFNAPRNYAFAPTKKQLHEGVDIMAIDMQGNPVPVFAAQRGVVDKVAFAQQGYGRYVRIVHQWGSQKHVTWYGHLSAATVSQGDFVLAGQKIGIAGTTGFSTGIHLHLTLQHIGHGLSNYTVDDVVDPAPFFRLDAVPPFDEALFLADVSVADGMEMRPGQSFLKTWRVRNTGTTAWTDAYRLAFAGEEHMSGPDDVTLPRSPIQPGEAINMTVRLTAPAVAGRHRSRWTFRHPDGSLFGEDLFTEVVVKEAKPIDEASYVADVTVEDGTIIQPGAAFVKTWRVHNTGTTTWTTDFSLRFLGDEQMGGPDRVALPREVKPDEMIELSVPLTAPQTAGRHRSTWKLANAQGAIFEFEQYAEIQVPQRVAPAQKLNELRWVADVTIPDETPVEAGQTFVKTWRVRNSGESTWGAGYTLGFFSGEQMGGPDSVPLPSARPGETVEVSVTLTAPAKPGLQRSVWKPRDPQGNVFEFDLFALVDVADAAQPTSELNELGYVADVTVEDGTVMRPGEAFVKTWRIRNTGTTVWGADYTLAFLSDDKMDGPDSVALPRIAPGEMAELSLMLTAPAASGLHKSTWKPRDPQGKFFDFMLFALIDVVDPNQTYDMLDYLRGDGRLYDLEFNWAGGGRQRVQTQVEGDHFYHVKNTEWEEMWADDHFINRGTDTSPGSGEVYTLFENGQYGSPWVPRRMTIGVPFRRTPLVLFRRKNDGAEVPNKRFVHATWIQLEAVHSHFEMPGGVDLEGVAVLAAFEDQNGKPKKQPFEHYYYAKNYGLVGWEGSLGRSTITQEFPRGSQPDNRRESLSWLTR